MKISNTFRNAAASILLAFILVFATNANASDKIKTPNVEVKYIGTINNSPMFQVEFDNESGEEVFITLRDGNGAVLYSEVTKEKKFSKRFRLEGVDFNDSKLTLNIRSKKENGSHVFTINKSVRQVEEVVVNKL